MTTLQMILCFWLAGSLLAMWKIWKPSYLVISKIDDTNILIQKPKAHINVFAVKILCLFQIPNLTLDRDGPVFLILSVRIMLVLEKT